MVKKVRASSTKTEAAITADIKSKILTEILKDMMRERDPTPAGYDRTPGVHDRYGKARGSAGVDEIVNPATRSGRIR